MRRGAAGMLAVILLAACGSSAVQPASVEQGARSTAGSDLVLFSTADSAVHILGASGVAVADVHSEGWTGVSGLTAGPTRAMWSAKGPDGAPRYYFYDYSSKSLVSTAVGNVGQVAAQGDEFVGLNAAGELVRYSVSVDGVASRIEPLQAGYALAALAPLLLGADSASVFIALHADSRLHLGGPSEVISVTRDGRVSEGAVSNSTRLVAAYRGAVTAAGTILAEGTAIAEEPCGHQLTTDLVGHGSAKELRSPSPGSWLVAKVVPGPTSVYAVMTKGDLNCQGQFKAADRQYLVKLVEDAWVIQAQDVEDAASVSDGYYALKGAQAQTPQQLVFQRDNQPPKVIAESVTGVASQQP